jgi:hypothetical protein
VAIVAWGVELGKKINLKDEISKTVSNLVPTLVVTACNFLIIPTSKLITRLEKWDFKYQTIN